MDKVYEDVTPDGMKLEAHVEADGLMRFSYKQDAEPVFEHVQTQRVQNNQWQRGVKQGMVHALTIPSGVVMELMGLGINVYQAPFKDIARGLHQLGRYQACDMTGKRLA